MMPQVRAEPTGPRMVTGRGQSDTHAEEITSSKTGEVIANPHPMAGLDYDTITGKEIAAMAANPFDLPKSEAPWFIGSDYSASDARSHDAQRENGSYHVLPADIDKGGPSLEQVDAAAKAVMGEASSFIIYSSSSATSDNPKWRVLFFVSSPVLGVDYRDTQDAIFDLFEDQGIQCDRALNRTGQLVFLPNVPPEKRGPDGQPLFYKYSFHRGGLVSLDSDHQVIKRREAVRRSVEEAREEAAMRRPAPVKRNSDEISPVDSFNRDNSLTDCMARYGYQQQGNSDHWQSPLQQSGSYAVRVYDGSTWVSLSGSDMAANIGHQKEYCCFGDAFDLFCHFEHNGDMTKAVRAYGEEIRPSASVVPIRDDLETDFGAAETRNEVQKKPSRRTVDGDLEEWVFLSGDNEFYHVITGRTMSKNAFDLAMAPITPKVEYMKADGEVVEKKYSASKTLIDHLGGVVAHSTMYRPDLPDNGDDVFHVGGIPFVNAYRPDSVPASCGGWKASEVWQVCEKHILNILGDEAGRVVIQWMAHNVQHPGRKILWAPIIVGVQGDGKTTLAKMLAAAMGHQNVSPVSPETMFSDFTGWAEGACVKVLEEIRVHGNSRHNAMNKLKPLITNDTVEIVRKGKDGKQVVNVTNYLALTNYMDALALDEGDRRWGVFKTKFDDRAHMLSEFDDDYWEALHGAIDGHPEVVRGWLMSVDLSGFNRVAGPEISDHKRAMIESTRSPDQIDVEEAIALGWHGVGEEILCTDCLNAAILAATAQRINTKRMATALESSGWVRRQETIKWSGKNRRVWWKKSARLGSASNDEIRSLLDKTEDGHDPVF